MKKRTLTLILALAACLCLASCGEKKEPQTVEDAIEQSKSAFDTLSEQAEDRDKKREDLIKKNRVDLNEEIVFTGSGFTDIKIKAYSVIPWNSLGEEQEQLYLIFDYTNKDTEDRYFYELAQLNAYQDGVQISPAVYIDDNATNAVRPGTTLERKEAFVLKNNNSDIELKITETRTGESSEYTIKLK